MSENRAADRGYSLVEMLVTIIMFTLIVGSITTVVITSMKHQNSLAARGTVLAQVRAALEEVDRDIRSANPLCAVSGTEVVLEETEPTTTIVDYKVVGTKLMYTKYSAVPSGTLICGNAAIGSVITSRTVLSNLVVGSTPVFTSPSAATFSTCPGGTTPAPLPTTVPTNIPSLTVSLSSQPANVTKPVSSTDCGTDLRKFTVTPTATATS